MRSRIASGTDTRSSFFMNSALRTLISGQIPATTGIRQCSMRRRKFFQQPQIEYRLRHRILRARLHFVFKAPNLLIEIRCSPGLAPTPITNAVPFPMGLPPRSSPRFRL